MNHDVFNEIQRHSLENVAHYIQIVANHFVKFSYKKFYSNGQRSIFIEQLLLKNLQRDYVLLGKNNATFKTRRQSLHEPMFLFNHSPSPKFRCPVHARNLDEGNVSNTIYTDTLIIIQKTKGHHSFI